MNESLTKTVEVLKAATQDIRALYVARYTEMELRLLNQIRAGLAAVGMDAEKYAPYPSGSRLTREQYRKAKFMYDLVRHLFTAAEGQPVCRRPQDPYLVVEKPDSERKFRARAIASANAEVDSYLFKLAGKIGMEIKSAGTNGLIWDGAILDVTCVDGSRQSWRTKCIINCSVYNKLFNQWPTRRLP